MRLRTKFSPPGEMFTGICALLSFLCMSYISTPKKYAFSSHSTIACFIGFSEYLASISLNIRKRLVFVLDMHSFLC